MKLLRLLFKRCIECLLVEVGEVLLAAAVTTMKYFCCGKIGHIRGKIGHLAIIFQSSKGANRNPPRKKTVHHVEKTVKYSPEDRDLCMIHSSPKLQPYKTDVEVNGTILQMELNTGASLLFVSEKTFREKWPNLEVSQSDTTLAFLLW